MATSSEQLLVQAEAALKAGQKQTARRLLQQVVQQDGQNHKAWLLLALAAPSLAESEQYIAQAEAIAPHDPLVTKARGWLQKQQSKGVKSSPTAVSPPPRNYKRFWLPAALLLLVVLMAGTAVLLWPRQTPNEPTAVASGPTAIMDTTVVVPTAVVPPTEPSPAQPHSTTPTPHPIQPKAISDNRQEARATWTLTPTPTNTPTPSPTWQPTFQAPQEGTPVGRPLNIASNEKWIDVNLTTQTLIAYEGNLPVFETRISSGLPQHETVTGQFRVWLRFEKQTMDGRRLGYDYYLEDVPYVMYFFEDYALHGTYWHNNFGYPMSHGCVNLYTPDAEWLFNWSQLGTVVNVRH